MTKETAKRGRPAKKTEPTKEKTFFKKHKKETRIVKEYELLGQNGIMFLLKPGPVSVYDESSDSIKSVRYIPQENSILVEDQTSKPIKRPIVFQNGKLFVNPNQPNLAKFLDLHPGNSSNGGNMFRKVDLEKTASLSIDSEYEVVDALVLIRDKPASDLLSVATALGYKTDRPFDQIKHDLMVYAKSNPKDLIESFDNPIIEAKALVKQALSFGIVYEKSGGICWQDNHQHIIACPVGLDPSDVLARFCLTEKGADVLSEIKRNLE